MKIIETDQYIIKCGQNQNENDLLITESNKDSLWFHLDKIPSPHVVMSKIDNDYEFIKNDYMVACQLCKDNSKAKTFKTFIIMTTIGKLKKTDHKGTVDIVGKVEKFLL